ncbi:MAG: winged helix-turn-helix transcriptional regulator [Roseibium sp.]|nr:winged helix-turn-helix transcriptional regulator [Roseibium sp.]
MTDLDSTFSALSHQARRAILKQLATGEMRLSDLAEPFDMSQTAVSKHVRILCDAGLVTMEQRGRTRYCRLNAIPMRAALDWIADYETFWQGQFDSLARHLAKEGL